MKSLDSDLYSPSLDERYDVYRMKAPMSPWPLLYGVLVGGFFIAGLGFGENFRRLGDRRAALITFAAGLVLTSLLFLLFQSDLVRFAKSTERRPPPTTSESEPNSSARNSVPGSGPTSGATVFWLGNLVALVAAWPIAPHQRRLTGTHERSGRGPGGGGGWIANGDVAYLCFWIGALREFAAS